MNKTFYSLGLMSGTSGDGIDASLAISDGKDKFDLIHNEYLQYSNDIFKITDFYLGYLRNLFRDMGATTERQNALNDSI